MSQLKTKLCVKGIAAILFVVMVGLMAGCTTTTVTYTKTTVKATGDVIEKTVTETDGFWLGNKSVSHAGRVGSIKLETTGGTTTGTMMPNLIIGDCNGVYGSSPTNDNKPMYGYSRSSSIWGSLTSASASGISYYYIGTKNETAEQTEQRMKALSEPATEKLASENPSLTTF